jgi:hypothetical protein
MWAFIYPGPEWRYLGRMFTIERIWPKSLPDTLRLDARCHTHG